jgi:hypothetical protein
MAAGLRQAVDSARQFTNSSLESRLTKEQHSELKELAAMYRAGELHGVSWRILAEQMRDRWNQERLQGETLKRNVLRIVDELEKSSQRSGRKKVTR